VLAIAVAWVARAAPPALAYQVLVQDSKASDRLLEDVAAHLQLVRVGRELRQGPETPVVSRVTVRAGQVAWSSGNEASVPVEYVMPDGTVVKCTVLVRIPGWLLTSVPTGGVECWPRPGWRPSNKALKLKILTSSRRVRLAA
jgi:hypothetical protein